MGSRIGVAAFATGNSKHLDYRAEERFPYAAGHLWSDEESNGDCEGDREAAIPEADNPAHRR